MEGCRFNVVLLLEKSLVHYGCDHHSAAADGIYTTFPNGVPVIDTNPDGYPSNFLDYDTILDDKPDDGSWQGE